MSKEQLLAEILRLPPDERRGLIGEVMDSLPEDEPDFSMTPELRAELERREAEMVAHPEREFSWEEVSARLSACKQKRQS
jgi:putative addiction module component (TIGR02574 family)